MPVARASASCSAMRCTGLSTIIFSSSRTRRPSDSASAAEATTMSAGCFVRPAASRDLSRSACVAASTSRMSSTPAASAPSGVRPSDVVCRVNASASDGLLLAIRTRPLIAATAAWPVTATGALPRDRARLQHERQGERRADLRLALDGDSSAHDVSELATDRETQTGAAELPGGGFVRLREGLEDLANRFCIPCRCRCR